MTEKICGVGQKLSHKTSQPEKRIFKLFHLLGDWDGIYKISIIKMFQLKEPGIHFN